MTRQQATELAHVLIAYGEGKAIQSRHPALRGTEKGWLDITDGIEMHHMFDYEWRVKPARARREWVICNNCGYATPTQQPITCMCHAPVTHVREVHLSKEGL